MTFEFTANELVEIFAARARTITKRSHMFVALFSLDALQYLRRK
jgi:hypothetical protein